MTALPLNNRVGKSIATQQVAQVLIAQYKAAYEAANRKPAPGITYAGGWFTMSSEAVFAGQKYRRRAIERMRDTLLERAAS